MLFSKRLGFKKIEDVILMESLSENLQNRLVNIIYYLFEDFSRKDYDKPWKVYSFLINNFFKEKIIDNYSEGYGFRTYFEDIIQKLAKLEWYAYYDVIEFLAKVDLIDNQLRELINQILELEMSGYRLMENNEFIPITDEISINTIDAISKSPFEYARNHIEKSISYLNEKENPDYNAVVREAISAVESCLIEVSELPSNKKNTLGVAVKKIKDDQNSNIELAFLKPFEMMYGLASNNGIRHAGNEKTIVSDISDAILVLTTCSAVINYLAIKLAKKNV